MKVIDEYWIMTHWVLWFSSNGLQVVKKINLKPGKSIMKAVNFTITVPSITNPCKNAVRFKLNEFDSPPLSLVTRWKPISSPIKFVRFLFVNLSAVCLNHLFKIIKLFLYLCCLFVLHPSQCLTVHCHRVDCC